MSVTVERPTTDAVDPQRLRARRLRAFVAAPSGVFAIVVLSLLAFCVILGPPLFTHAATTSDFTQSLARPSWHHLLGTDSLGRDIMAQVIVASRLSLEIGVAAAGLAFAVGVFLGSVTTVLAPRWRSVVLRFIDLMLSFPGLLIAITIGVVVGLGAKSVILGIGIAGSFGFARTTSTLALGVGGREYLHAARVVGVRRGRILLRYVLPNIAEPLLLFLGIAVGFSILGATGLSFLGLGVQPPSFDWGRLLTLGLQSIYTTPAAAIGPAAAVAITALAFGYAGEAAARAMNPLLWTEGAKKKRVGPPPARDEDAGRATGARIADVDPRVAGPANADAVVDVRDLVVTFPGRDGPIDIVKGLTFTVRKGEMLGIVGESGSGKTMTAMAIAQLTPYPGRVEGTLMLHGQPLRELSKGRLAKLMGTEVAVVFQNPMAALNPALMIGRQLVENARRHRGLSRKEAAALAERRLTEVHIPSARRQMRRYPHEFSGGMRQRALIAMGLMNEPSLLIADEPTTALDVTIQAQIMDLLHEVNEQHETAIILISHNLALVSHNCDRVLVMYAGRIVEDLDVEQLRTNPQHPYTRALVASVPELGHERGKVLEYIPGEQADIANPPSGCPYHPRCPLAIARCRTDRPLLVTRPGENGHRVACHVANADVAAVPALPVA
jgi:peptide/nickel transport system permease protein